MIEFIKLKLVDRYTKESFDCLYKTSNYRGYTYVLSNSPMLDGYKIPENLRMGYKYSYAISDKPNEFLKRDILLVFNMKVLSNKQKLYTYEKFKN